MPDKTYDEAFVNAEEGISRVMNNAKFYAKLLTKFKDDKNMDILAAALKDEKLEETRVAAHTLKSLVANLSLTKLHKLCIEIENQVKAGSIDPAHLPMLEDTYNQTISQVDKVIAQYG